MRTKPMIRIAKQAANEISCLRCQPCIIWEYKLSSPAHDLKAHYAKHWENAQKCQFMYSKINKLCEDPDSNTAKQLGNVQHVLHL